MLTYKKTYFLKALTAQDAQEQLRLFNMSIDEYPKCVIALWERAKLLRDLERFDDALTDIQRLLKVNPYSTEAYVLAATIYYRKKRNIPAAKQQLLAGLKVDATNIGSYELLAEIYAREDKDLDKCIELLDDGISKGASKLELIYFKCSLSLYFGNFDQALQYVLQCTEILAAIKIENQQQEQEKIEVNQNLVATIRVIETLRDHLADFPEWHKIVQENKQPYFSLVSEGTYIMISSIFIFHLEQIKNFQLAQAKKSKSTAEEDLNLERMVICFAYVTFPLLLRSFSAKVIGFLTLLKDPNYNFIRYACNNAYVVNV